MPDLRIAQSTGDSTNIDGFPGVAAGGTLSLTDLNNTIATYLATNGYNPGSGGFGGQGYGSGGGTVNLTNQAATSQNMGDIPSSGMDELAARDDHVHGMPSFGSVYPQLIAGLSPSDGISQEVARTDHTHGTPVGVNFGTVVAEQTFGGSSSSGTANTASHSDHTHGNPSDAPLVHLATNETITGIKTFNAATYFNANITAPNIIYTVTASGNLASSGGQNPAISITATPTFSTVTINGPGTALSVLNAASIGTTLTVTGAVTLNNTLSVAGTSTLAGLNAQATTTTTLTASGNTAVTGTANFNVGTGATILGGTLSVSGTSTLGVVNAQGTTTTTLTANGVATFNANTAVTGTNTFTVGTGATSLGGTLSVSGTSTLGVLNAQSTTVTNLHSTGTGIFDGNTNVTGSATFTVGTGATSLGGSLNVTGTTQLSSTLNVTGATTLQSTLTAQGTTVTTLHATSTTTLDGNVSVTGGATFSVAVGATTLGGSLTVSASTALQSTLVVTGTTTLNANTSVTGTSTFTVGTGASTLGGTLTVTGAVTHNSTTTLNGNTSVTGGNTFNVGTGASTLGGSLTVSGPTTINNTTTLNGNTSVTGASTFTVGTGATSLGGTLSVAGASTLNGNTSVTGTSTFTVGTGASTLNGTLDVIGAVTNHTTMHTVGATTLDYTLSVGSTANFLGSAYLTQASTSFTIGDISITRTFTGNVIKSNNIIDGQVQANDQLTYQGYVEDGSFEERPPATTTWTIVNSNATLGGWQITSDVLAATNNAYNGTYYGTHINGQAVGNTDFLYNNALFPVVGNTLYFAQCQGKSTTGTNGTTTVVITFYDNLGNVVAGTVNASTPLVNGVGTYATLYATFTAPATAVHGRVSAQVTGKTIGQVYVDAFTGGPGVQIPDLSINAATKLVDKSISEIKIADYVLDARTLANNAIPDPITAERIFAPAALSCFNLTSCNYINAVEDQGFEQNPTTATTTWDVIFTDANEMTPDTQYQVLSDQPRAHLGNAYLLHNPTLATNIGGNSTVAHAHSNMKVNCKYGDSFYGSCFIRSQTAAPPGAIGTNTNNLLANGQVGFGYNYHDSMGQSTFVFVVILNNTASDSAYTFGSAVSTAPLSAASVHIDMAIANHTQGFWLWDDTTLMQKNDARQVLLPNTIDGTLITTGAFNIPSSSTTFSGNVQINNSTLVVTNNSGIGTLAFNVTNGIDQDINFHVTASGVADKYSLISPSTNNRLSFGIGGSERVSVRPDGTFYVFNSNGNQPGTDYNNYFFSVQPLYSGTSMVMNSQGGEFLSTGNNGVLYLGRNKGGGVQILQSTSISGTLSVSSTLSVSGVVNGPAIERLDYGLRSNVGVTGGGTIAMDGSYNLSWSARFIVISQGNSTSSSTSGYFDIAMPASGTAVNVAGGAAARNFSASGVVINAWEALWYVLPIGGSNGTVASNFWITSYTSAMTPPSSDWILLAVRNGDDGMVRLCTGYKLNIGASVPANGFGGSALYDVNTRVYSANNTPPYPVTSVAGRTGAVTLTAADVGAGTFPGAVTFASTTAHTGAATFASTVGITGNLTAPNVIYSVAVGTGISSTGGQNPTIANTGVTSIVAGTNVTISGATGAVTVNATVPVSSVAGRTGAVTLTAADVGAGTFPSGASTFTTAPIIGALALAAVATPTRLQMDGSYASTATPTNQQLKIDLAHVSSTEAYGWALTNDSGIWHHAGASGGTAGYHVLATANNERLRVNSAGVTVQGTITASSDIRTSGSVFLNTNLDMSGRGTDFIGPNDWINIPNNSAYLPKNSAGTSDFNTLQNRISGFWTDSATVNNPLNNSNWWNCVQVRHQNPSNNYGFQLASEMTGASGLYYRPFQGGNGTDAGVPGGAWYRVYTQEFPPMRINQTIRGSITNGTSVTIASVNTANTQLRSTGQNYYTYTSYLTLTNSTTITATTVSGASYAAGYDLTEWI